MSLPIILYNIPGRTGVNIEPATMQAARRNRQHRRRERGVREHFADGRDCSTCVPERFLVLSGDDAITLPLLALGGRGLISVVVE